MTELESDIREALAYLNTALAYAQAGDKTRALEGALEARGVLEDTILREGYGDD